MRGGGRYPASSGRKAIVRVLTSRRSGIALAVAWLGIVFVIDVATGPEVRLAGLYAIAPLIVCASLPPAGTAVFAVASVLLGIGSGWWNDSTELSVTVPRVIDLVLVAGAGVLASAVRERREAQLRRVSALAAVAQRSILPVLPERVSWVSITARYEAAGDDALVGGDLYDCYAGDGMTRLVIGDARGKGVAAVEQAARVIRAFRQAAASAPTLPEVAEHMSGYLSAYISDPEEFVTALLLEISEPDHVTVVSCGHPAPVHITPAGAATETAPTAGLPLGWGDCYTSTDLEWNAGDRLLLFTDGLVEARNGAGEFLPLLDIASALADGTTEDAADTLLEGLHRHVPGLRLVDDVAVVVVQNSGTDVGSKLAGRAPTLADLVPRARA